MTWHGRSADYACVVAMDFAFVKFAKALAPARPTTRLRQSHATSPKPAVFKEVGPRDEDGDRDFHNLPRTRHAELG